MLRCLAITGPTACGKTDLALALADEFPVEIVSMDSAMVYRGMDIGTAKPGIAERRRVKHHLVDILEPEDSYSAGRFAADALRLIGAVNARGNLPLLVGGTMLYLKALRDGIARLPQRDPALRSALDVRAAEQGWPALHAELAKVDPAAAARIEATDRQRIQRALEVYQLTGRTMTELQQGTPDQSVAFPAFALIPEDRAGLAEAIAERFEAMLDAGLVDEVRGLHERPGLTADSTSMRAVGYRQIWAWLDGNVDFSEARQHAVTATRQLAKRQLTWLRRDEKSEKLVAGKSGSLERLRNQVRLCVENA